MKNKTRKWTGHARQSLAWLLFHFGDLVSKLPWFPYWLYNKPMLWSSELDKENKLWNPSK